ncbi:MAG: hypothetical protein A2747_00835 [Candidatus Yonathbacteria bacterium RIFCSPHIGHO2_01_FULL_44_41]|uniref:Glycosyl transferase family 1 domain-containing protein n=1 Tax=Candidatus Yonathbacteria bacterium RIFCSPHIGHO2_02_FULL_44_14 TaxID=1802724 RepID=A0A1G2S5H7_9BACT|nr:MAG: hypothetical protein A2747_00835 [Candidatus Yonathbacteria bacterium RIFCSPHIGHO2_01_FULL_44_41]OHA80364.1 MAG: hypothetical protein A3D51_03550 [Candidatus Yonathbacteria bacterium RIFCSPHIGHO2_02_FULL_44_14]OHA80672.1 MAG: hypothetical protein A3B06_03775 [Candidatus Yonathbacteria bacterium RIFCSPLOWO2_01_FULL_43_20]
MKVLIISTDRKVFEEGSAVRSRLLEYGRLVNELHVIVFAKRTSDFRNETIPPNIFLYPTNSLGRFFHVPYAIIRALKLKRRGVSIDVVTTQDPFEAGFAGFIISHLLNAGLHIQIHTDVMSSYFARESILNQARVVLAKFLLSHADAIRVVSERIKNSLSQVNCQKSKVSILPIFVEIKNATDLQERDLKKKYPQFDFHILVASRLTREKNIKSAIEAMRSVVSNHLKIGLIIVGSGPEEVKLKELVACLSLGKNVIFEGWRNDLSDYYKTANVLILPSYYEGYGMVAVEALSQGCPVVMTDVGCAGEVVKDGENGLVVPVGDTGALAGAIEGLVSGKLNLKVEPPKLPTKEEYLVAYKKSWDDALI